MQYPYLLSLEIITIFLTLFLSYIFFYLLIKKIKEANFRTNLKTFCLYELCSIFLFSIFSFLNRYIIFGIIGLIIFALILFFVFYLIARKTLALNWKKSLLIFVVLILLINPFLDFLRLITVQKISDLHLFTEEVRLYYEQIEKMNFGVILFLGAPILPQFRIIGIIERATLSWPLSQFIYFQQLSISF